MGIGLKTERLVAEIKSGRVKVDREIANNCIFYRFWQNNSLRQLYYNARNDKWNCCCLWGSIWGVNRGVCSHINALKTLESQKYWEGKK